MAEQDRQSRAADEPSTPTVKSSQASSEQWVVTFGDSGEIVKVEKIDSDTGERKELSEEEYAAASGMDLSGASDYWDYYGAGATGMEGYMGYGQPDLNAYAAYYQGMSDAMQANYGNPGMTAEEMAYYQGMVDYMTYCM